MKRLFICLLALLLLSGCGQAGMSAPAETPEARPAELKTELLQGLNLDGVGDADDAVYISQLQFGDAWDDNCTALRVHLGTGKTMSPFWRPGVSRTEPSPWRSTALPSRG